jgi:hypothetical protein
MEELVDFIVGKKFLAGHAVRITVRMKMEIEIIYLSNEISILSNRSKINQPISVVK